MKHFKLSMRYMQQPLGPLSLGRVNTPRQQKDEYSPEDRNTYFQEEVHATRWEPYTTTIKHFSYLTKNYA